MAQIRRNSEGQGQPKPRRLHRRPSKAVHEKRWGSQESLRSPEGPKVMVRYEDLRADTPRDDEGHLLCTGDTGGRGRAGASGEKARLGEHLKEKKGRGKFHRKAKPGGWRRTSPPIRQGASRR